MTSKNTFSVDKLHLLFVPTFHVQATTVNPLTKKQTSKSLGGAQFPPKMFVDKSDLSKFTKKQFADMTQLTSC